MKNEGITMMQIVITIVIMIILATIAVLYGQGIPKEARLSSIYNEIREVESTLKQAKLLNKLVAADENLSIYEEITVPKVEASSYESVLGAGATGDFYYLDFTTSRKLENVLDLENVNNDYILDYSNLNIYLIKGIEINEGDTITIKYNSDEIETYYESTFKR